MRHYLYSDALRTVSIVGPLAHTIGRRDERLARTLRAASAAMLLHLHEVGRPDWRGLHGARGSASEGVACLDAAIALGYIEPASAADAQSGFERVGRTLEKLARKAS